tara:strand:- start:137 stop:313 length:177 start_codon:yes stop_codon:yes gene_type:complete
LLKNLKQHHLLLQGLEVLLLRLHLQQLNNLELKLVKLLRELLLKEIQNNILKLCQEIL